MKVKQYKEYEKMFEESDSYLEMMMLADAHGGNKAKMNLFLQNQLRLTLNLRNIYDIYDIYDIYKKTILFIKQGIVNGEVSMKLLWNALNCPKDIECLKKK